MRAFFGFDAVAAERGDGLHPELRALLMASRDTGAYRIDRFGNIAPAAETPVATSGDESEPAPVQYAVSGL